ncbi:hypothetical protein M758_1G048700, partial [Ceratodon purpureus]
MSLTELVLGSFSTFLALANCNQKIVWVCVFQQCDVHFEKSPNCRHQDHLLYSTRCPLCTPFAYSLRLSVFLFRYEATFYFSVRMSIESRFQAARTYYPHRKSSLSISGKTKEYDNCSIF